MEQVTFNAVGKYRRETLNGRSYLVVPMTSIVPGVLPGSKGPLYYPPDQISRNVSSWNGMPLTMYHPTDRFGNPAPAKHDAHTIVKHRIGRVRNSTWDGKLKHEAWFNEAKTRNADKRWGTDVYDRIINGKPIELSTGLGTVNVQAPPGYVDHKGERYDGLIATNYAPDHIAVLPNQTGACSLRDGCGVGVTNSNVGECPKCGKTMSLEKDGFCLNCEGTIMNELVEKRSFLSKLAGWLGVTNDQARHPKDGRYQGHAHPAAKRGFNDSRVVESDDDPMEDDDVIEDANTDEPTKNNNNPEGINQYTSTAHVDPKRVRSLKKEASKLGVKAKWVGDHGRGLTSLMKMKLSGDKEHVDDLASDYHYTRNEKKCTCGTVLENEHDTCLNCMAGGKTTNEDDETTNRRGSVMALKENEKKAVVDFLVTNCDCWKGEHNRKVLNSLPDDNLVKLKKQTETATENALVINQLREDLDADLNMVTTNDFPAFIKKKMDAKKGADDETDDSSVVDNDADNPSFQSVKNSKKPTLAEWEATMPQEASAVWNHAKLIVNEETTRLTEALNRVAAKETNPQRKTLIVNRLKSKPTVSDLRDLLTLVSPVATQNTRPELTAFPSYLGAAGGPDAMTRNDSGAGDDVLNTLTMDDIDAEERDRKSA